MNLNEFEQFVKALTLKFEKPVLKDVIWVVYQFHFGYCQAVLTNNKQDPHDEGRKIWWIKMTHHSKQSPMKVTVMHCTKQSENCILTVNLADPQSIPDLVKTVNYYMLKSGLLTK